MRTALLLWFAMLLASCASTGSLRLGPVDEAALLAQARTTAADDIRVSATIPDREQARTIFGVDLTAKGIQPLWLEIRNDSDRQLYFLPTGLDPEYFSSREVSFKFHGPLPDEASARLDIHIESLGLAPFIEPHSTEAGFVFTNPDKNHKFVTVDLIARKWARSFKLVAPTPDRASLVETHKERLDRLMAGTEWTDVDDEGRLRELLEQLPCCVKDAAGAQAEPLNLVLVGQLFEITSAGIRRNYRAKAAAPRYLFGRPQDIASGKLHRWVAAQPHVFRIWLTGIRFRGRPVWIGQISTPVGGRFAWHPKDTTVPMEPDVDEARIDMVQDMIYSQSLARIGFVKGVGHVDASQPREIPGGGTYHTDGLRAVLFFEGRQVSLSRIGFVDWERLVDHYRKQLDATGSNSGP